MENCGEKKIRFRREGLGGINDMLFQVTDVGKPLASVLRILDKGNTVVFSRKQEVRTSSTTALVRKFL